MSGFYQLDQLELCAPFIDQFYQTLPDLSQKHAYKYTETFCYYMLPRVGDIEDRHIAELISIKSQVPDNNQMYMNMLQDCVELLLSSKGIRELAASK